jgi:hypothetical protein
VHIWVCIFVVHNVLRSFRISTRCGQSSILRNLGIFVR